MKVSKYFEVLKIIKKTSQNFTSFTIYFYIETNFSHLLHALKVIEGFKHEVPALKSAVYQGGPHVGTAHRTPWKEPTKPILLLRLLLSTYVITTLSLLSGFGDCLAALLYSSFLSWIPPLHFIHLVSIESYIMIPPRAIQDGICSSNPSLGHHSITRTTNTTNNFMVET